MNMGESAAESTAIKTPNGQPDKLPPALVKQFVVSLAKEQIEHEIDQLADRYSQKAKIPGFRQGKVPRDVVKKAYKKELNDEVIHEALNRLAFERIKNDGLRIASQPVVEKVDYQEGQDLTAQIAVEVLPEIVLPEIDALEVEVSAALVKGDEFDEQKQIDAVLDANKRTVPVSDRGLQDNDLALLKVQNKILTGNKMSPRRDVYYMVNPETDNEIAGLYHQVIGKPKGNRVVFTQEYAADHAKKTWAGKRVEHHVEVDAVYELKRPALDDGFLKAVGVKDENEFRQRLRQEFDRQQVRRREDLIMQAIFARLQEQVDFPVPDSLIEHEIGRQMNQNRHPVQFKTPEERDQYIQSVKDNARRSVKLSLILSQIGKKYGVAVSQQDIDQEFRNQSQQHGLAEKEIRQYFSNPEHLENLKDHLFDQKVLALVREKVKIKEG